MSKADLERQHLSLADKHIADGERRITEQEVRLLQLEREEPDRAEGERLLVTLKESLEQYHVHRRMIVDALRKAETNEGQPPEG